MTKTEARKIAKRARQYGYLNKGYDGASGADLVQVFCPRCNERVTGYASQYGDTVPKALDKAMIGHLLEECRSPEQVDVIDQLKLELDFRGAR